MESSGWASARGDGFTLLEVLVALIIFSIAFGTITGILQTSLRQSTAAENLLEATAFAEQQIARYGIDLPLNTGQTTGVSPSGLGWRTEIALAGPTSENSDVALYRITVDVDSDDGEERYVSVQTLRIGALP